MPLPVYRLRRWLAAIAVLFTVVIAGMYLSVRLRQRNVLKEVPNKIGIDIKQTATGFQFSKSEGGRTLFTIQASNLKEFKFNGRAELHNVSIILYGRDSSRFDQIYGDDFAYDQKTGDVTAQGDVQIDLEANPAGTISPDQSTPKELRNPIHLKTRDLVFNKETGNAWTKARVEFRTAQATGSAVGVSYVEKTNTLTLESQVRAEIAGPSASVIEAKRGFVTRDPRQIALDSPRLVRAAGILQADEATFFLSPDNNIERVHAKGNVKAQAKLEAKRNNASRAKKRPGVTVGSVDSLVQGSSDQQKTQEMLARADEADLVLTGKQPVLQTASLTGNVQVERIGFQTLEGSAGRVILDFTGQNQVRKVHAEQEVRLTQQGQNATSLNAASPTPPEFELTAPAVDFRIAQGRRLEQAVTSGAAQITIVSAQPPTAAGSPAPQRTVVTAGRFEAQFQPTSVGSSRLASIHGAPDAKIVNTGPGQPERISTSQVVEATFLPQGGMESLTQQGNVAYTDNQSPEKRVQAWADHARYTPADQMLMLTGSPRITNAGMSTTANSISINRATGDAIANGDVKSTYSQLKEQPNGALLASSSPIHVTARTMTARNSPAIALYSGKARLWQDANIIEAPSIQFDREHRSATAQGSEAEPVSTIVLQPEKSPAQKVQSASAEKSSADTGKQKSRKTMEKSAVPMPIAITGRKLIYVDAERKAHYDGRVVAKGADFTASADEMDVYFLARKQISIDQPLNQPAQLDRMVAQGHVVIQQPSRRAEGQTLIYTASEDKFVLTGGPPSIFDAEQGKITGVSLTFFRRDDRVLVEGEAGTPVVTETRVAR